MATEFHPKRDSAKPPELPGPHAATPQAESGAMAGDGEAAALPRGDRTDFPPMTAPAPPPLPGAASGAQAGDAKAKPAEPGLDADESDDAPSRRLARRRPAGPSRGRIAANDDAPSIGGLIYALEQKPSDRPFRYAAVASGLWGVVWLVFAGIMVWPHIRDGASFFEIVARSNAMLIAAAIFVPVCLFWFLAVLAWRTEELKLRSSTMTEVAIRLAEPDRMAEQSIASLGQAVRRQVSFMNDAVARALGRAGELEALVHNEVSALERSYEENERKIRGLIQELAGERHALVNTSERVSETLRGLGTEIPQLIEKLSVQQVKLTDIIEGAGQNLTSLESAITATSHQLETSVANSTGMLETTLGGHATRLQTVLEDYTSALGVALETRTHQMQQAFDTHAQQIDGRLGERTAALESVFHEYANALDSSLAHRTQTIDSQLIERTRALDDAFSERLKLFDDSILRSTMAIDGAITERSAALSTALEQHAQTMSETVGRQATELDETLMHGINAVRRSSESITRQSLKAIEGLASQSDVLKNISENLLGQINTVTSRFEQQGSNIVRAASTLENANYRIDSTLQARHADLSRTLDRLSGKAEELGEFLQGYSTSIEGSVNDVEQRARLVSEQMVRGTESRSLAALAEIERLRQSTDSETQRALEDLRSRFTSVETEMSQHLGSLTNRFDATSQEVRQRAQHAAEALEHEQARLRQQIDTLPATAQAGAEAMRRSLQDQLRALDQLSALAHREARGRDVSPPVALHATDAMPPQGQIDQGYAQHPMAPGGGAAHYGQPTPPREDRQRLSSLTNGLTREMAARHPQPQQHPAPPMQPPQRTPSPQAQAAAAPASAAQREAWSLGDLLARASVEEDGHDHGAAGDGASGGGHAGQSAMLEIAQLASALDAATASAIWSRLRAGQRGVMVRSIYPPGGRDTFDEVTRRYAADPGFQNTVNRYLADFERILRDIEQKDPSGRTAQSYAVSETGRVYLFLAHASGRLA